MRRCIRSLGISDVIIVASEANNTPYVDRERQADRAPGCAARSRSDTYAASLGSGLWVESTCTLTWFRRHTETP
jgi:hypothetical protein